MRDAPELRRFRARDDEIAYWDWAGAEGAPTILMLHATGFHGRVWDAAIQAFDPGFRVIALEMPGHGQSPPRGPISAWSDFTPPVVDLIDDLGLEGLIGVGHSMGGYIISETALERPSAFAGLMLIDPVMHPPEFAGIDRFPGLAGPEAHPVAKRRDRWPDWRAFHDRFKDRKPYSLWRPDIFEAYCRHGFRPAPDGDGQVLACAPILEASIYFNSWRADILDRLRGIAAPATVLRAYFTPRDPLAPTDYLRSTTWAGLVDYFQDAEDVHLPHLTHFIPMQAPELVAEHLAALAERALGR